QKKSADKSDAGRDGGEQPRGSIGGNQGGGNNGGVRNNNGGGRNRRRGRGRGGNGGGNHGGGRRNPVKGMQGADLTKRLPAPPKLSKDTLR
ncbi:hypothetical protein NL360_27865, partial [Klebsiella pneumoniae]|nr:hypothetical protein [Klebsiella pneumoniae]